MIAARFYDRIQSNGWNSVLGNSWAGWARHDRIVTTPLRSVAPYGHMARFESLPAIFAKKFRINVLLVNFTFIFGALLLFGIILALLLGGPILALYVFINPYFVVGILLSFIAGLILVLFSSLIIEKKQESSEKTRNFRFIRWYIASPLLILILLEIFGYISHLASDSDVSHLYDGIKIPFGIFGILIVPEIIRFMKYLIRH